MNYQDHNIRKFAALQDELETAIKLIKAGLGELQEIDMDNDFYHLPHQLLASGFERLMKCYILLVHAGRTGQYPNITFLKELGHDLVNLLHTICREYYGRTVPLVKADFEFLKRDGILRECMRILSLFGRKGRYYNLDIITGSQQDPILTDPKKEWEKLENEVEDSSPYVGTDEIYTEYFPRVNRKLVATMERFVRAISLQFTVGRHKDPHRHLIMSSAGLGDFIRMTAFGVTDYRKSARILRQERDTWEEFSDFDIANSPWPTREVHREGGDERWPFRVDQVIVERRGRIFYIVYVEGYAFALNGAARNRYKYPDVHAAGVAIIGKSVGPFIDIAKEL